MFKSPNTSSRQTTHCIFSNYNYIIHRLQSQASAACFLATSPLQDEWKEVLRSRKCPQDQIFIEKPRRDGEWSAWIRDTEHLQHGGGRGNQTTDGQVALLHLYTARRHFWFKNLHIKFEHFGVLSCNKFWAFNTFCIWTSAYVIYATIIFRCNITGCVCVFIGTGKHVTSILP